MKFNLEVYRNYLDMKIASLKEMLGNSEVSEDKKRIYKEQILLLRALKFESEMFED
jgi:hypothetical protein